MTLIKIHIETNEFFEFFLKFQTSILSGSINATIFKIISKKIAYSSKEGIN